MGCLGVGCFVLGQYLCESITLLTLAEAESSVSDTADSTLQTL
jgi:hypothetical protein